MRQIDQTTALITGATDGLGRGVAERLAEKGAHLHLHGRDRQRLTAAAEEIASVTGNDRIHTHLADLSSLDEVRRLADQIAAGTHSLHLLISNAGIGSGKPEKTTRQESRDGYELRFAVNYLAGFLLTVRLLPLLRESAPARVVNVSSLGQAPIDFDDVMLERSYGGTRAYARASWRRSRRPTSSPSGSRRSRSPSAACTRRRSCRPRSCSRNTASRSTSWRPGSRRR